MSDNYVIPTKKSPVFTAYCTAFGTIERGLYKQWNIKEQGKINQVGDTCALDYIDAVNFLHEWIKDEVDSRFIKENPSCKFCIKVIDGKLNKWDEVVEVKVYEISAAKAKKYIL